MFDYVMMAFSATVSGFMVVVCFFRTVFAAMDVMSLRKNDCAEQISIFYTNEEFYKKRVKDLYIQGVFFVVFLSTMILALSNYERHIS